MKYQAEGWPSSITDPSLTEEERENAKLEYVMEAAKKYGIQFTIDEVQSNPGLKFIAKLYFEINWHAYFLFLGYSIPSGGVSPCEIAFL